MHKRTTALLLSGSLAVGAFGALAVTPASAATSDNPVSSRLASIKSALTGLVKDGTLTQAQADKVAGTLDSKLPEHGPGGFGGPGGPGGPGHHGLRLLGGDAAAAKALGITEAQLRTALKGGTSLADVAKSKKVSVDALVQALVADAKKNLSTAVEDKRLTQAQADEMTKTLTARITDLVNGVRPERGMHRDGDFGGPGKAASGAGSSSSGTSGSSGSSGSSDATSSSTASTTGWSVNVA